MITANKINWNQVGVLGYEKSNGDEQLAFDLKLRPSLCFLYDSLKFCNLTRLIPLKFLD